MSGAYWSLVRLKFILDTAEAVWGNRGKRIISFLLVIINGCMYTRTSRCFQELLVLLHLLCNLNETIELEQQVN